MSNTAVHNVRKLQQNTTSDSYNTLNTIQIYI